MANYYQILGVSRNASDEEIKTAYRSLARTHHPDKGGDKEHFQKIQEAYEHLSNPQKKAELDNVFQFNTFHHTATQRQKKNNHYYNLRLTLDEIYFGCTKKLKIKRNIICKKCTSTCYKCNGQGTFFQQLQMGPFTQTLQQTCMNCKGNGWISDSPCNCINGIFLEEKVMEINIERGVLHGKQYLFEEWGEQTTNRTDVSGDLVVSVNQESHETFSRNNLDLLCDINVSLLESIIGKNVIVPHFDGPIALDTSGFGIINPFKKYTIFGKGFIQGNTKGDLHLKFNIQYPNKTLTTSQRNDIEKCFNEIL